MIRLFYTIPTQKFIDHLVQNDRDVITEFANYEIEKDEIAKIMIEHFHHMGIYLVNPLKHADYIKEHMLIALKSAPVMKERRAEVQKLMKKAREKSRRFS